MVKRKSGNIARFWESDSGWKAVEVGDDVLLGAEEYGFAGLEELDPSCLGGLLGFNGDVGPEQAADAGLSRMQSEGSGAGPKQLRNKRKKHDSVHGDAVSTVDEGAAPGGQQGVESVDTLKAKIAKLESENAKLRGSSEGSQQRKKKGKSATEKKKAASQEKGGKKADDKNGPLADVQSWAPFELHPLVERAIAQLGFSSPTEVQTECLPAAIRDRRDVIGAAQTGSGKTLAFGLPIMQLLLQEREREQGGAGEDSGGGGGPAREGPDGEAAGQAKHAGAAQGEARAARGGKLRALILAPTRELAMQVCEHLQAVGKTCGIWVVPIVGGISALKQERLLSKNPEVVVASPGRLWDLMKTGQRHVTDLSQLSFLVIDEADRMVQQGHYQELTDILAAIPRDAAPATTANDVPLPPLAGADGAVGEGLDGEHEDAGPEAQQSQGLQGRGVRQRRRLLQTFVFSATLTLPASLRKRLRKGGGGATGSASLDSLMDRIPFRAKPKIVDLTSQRKIADKVEEAYIECGESERDEYLYCILARHPGRTLVFVNAISSVRRLGAILKLLGLPAHPLHAGMQQRARLKALDRFKADPNAIMVATDVAARGLDVKDVRCVVHYQIPASVDVYVHRSGRTARAEAEGVSIALVTPKESARFLALLKALHRPPPPEFPVDLSLMPAAHKRVRLAVRLDDISRRQSKARADKSWRQQNAEAVGIVLSDDSQDEEEVEGARRGKKARKNKAGARGPDQEATAEEIRAELSSLLAEPLQPSYSRKFFTGGAAAAVAAHLPQAPSPSQLAAGSAAHARQPQQGLKRKGRGRAAADAAGDELRAAPSHASTVSHAVGLASSMAASRVKTASEVKAKVSKKRQKAKQKDPRSAALQAALAKHGAKRKGAGNRGLVVIPQAFGRDAAGPDALQALRSKLASI